ncbi:MAG: hypothetical protein EOM28_10930 [Clostridia bacterium]|nr:hypothetical protein [Anaerotignum sp.]NCC16839.1 hypothetical protein [Clostridia bacterium]
MKKYIIYFMTALLLIGATACGKKADAPQPEQAQAEGVLPEDMTSMDKPIDALLRCMLENNTAYDSTDPEFFWSALYYFLGENSTENPLVTITEDDRIKVPRKVAQEYAIALFANYDDLLPLPEALSASITYDEDWDAYLLTQGDRGLAETVLSDYKEADNSYTVTAKLISTMEDKDVLCESTITMQKNAFADGITDPKYLYSIAEVTQVSGFRAPPESVSAVFNGLADSHTVEVTLEDGTIQAFQFYDSEVSKKLHSLKEGDAFSFVYQSDDKTGVLTILQLN